MIMCMTCQDKGRLPHCPACFRKEDRELVYLPSLPPKKMKRKKQKSKPKISSKEKNLLEIEKDAQKRKIAFLSNSYDKLKMVKSPSTGSKEVDDMIVEMFGDWRDPNNIKRKIE